MLAGLMAPRLWSPASIVARHVITLIVRLGTQYTILYYIYSYPYLYALNLLTDSLFA